MYSPLDNPVYFALTGRDAHLGTRWGELVWFDADLSPFAGFTLGYEQGFSELYDCMKSSRRMLFASRDPVSDFDRWQVSVHLEGKQFVYDGGPVQASFNPKLEPLNPAHAAEMVALAARTKPGPFDTRTIEFGHYYGVFEEGRLVAMTGQRMHLPGYSEISAVCTDPGHTGKGYGAALIQQQLALIGAEGDMPFLHVRADNERAIALYERLGFVANGPMHFYFLKRQQS